MKKLTALLMVALLTPSVFAHEGHGHSEGVEARNGGAVVEGKEMHLEIVTEGSDLKIFPLKKDGTLMALKDVKLTATGHPPKKPVIKIDLKPMTDHFHAKVEAKGSKRFELQIEATAAGKAEKFKSQVEPQG